MGKRSSFGRIPRDFCPTPRSAVLPLIPHLRGVRAFAEPCCGDGTLVRRLEGFGLRCAYAGEQRIPSNGSMIRHLGNARRRIGESWMRVTAQRASPLTTLEPALGRGAERHQAHDATRLRDDKMATGNPHVLLEMTDEPDCRFVAAWLTKVAEAQTLWSQALKDHRFADHVLVLHADGIPDLAAAALEIFGELEHHCHVVALNLYRDGIGLFSLEFGLLVQLGLFVVVGPSYWMAIPEVVTLTAVKQAAFDVLSTADDSGDGVEVVQPERLLQTLTAIEAEAWRSRLIMMRRFAITDDHGSIQ